MLLFFALRIIPIEGNSTIIVPDDYPSIQEAINAANEGDTIFVRAGRYDETVIINKSISLIGEDRATTIIESSISIFNTSVEIKGFTVVASNEPAIIAVNSSGKISNNIFRGVCGIILLNSSGTMISDNTFRGLKGDYDPPVGILLINSSRISIERNEINSTYVGILTYNTNSSLMINNTLYCSLVGVLFLDSTGNVLRGNNFAYVYTPIKISAYPFHFFPRVYLYRTFLFHLTARSAKFPPLQHFIHYIDETNTIDGKPIYYLINENDLTITPATFPEIGYLALVNSTNVRIRNLNLTGVPLFFAYTDNSIIEDSTFTADCSIAYIPDDWETNIMMPFVIFGITFYSSQNNILRGNTLLNHPIGICLYQNSNKNTIINNTIITSGVGFLLYSTISNTIRENKALNCNFGIFASYSNDTVIEHNRIKRSEISSGSIGFMPVYQTHYFMPEYQRPYCPWFFKYSGLLIFYAFNNFIKDNEISLNYVGLSIVCSGNNTLRDNKMEKNKYNFYAPPFLCVQKAPGVWRWITTMNDVDTSNTIDGKPIYYWTNRHNEEIPKDAGLVELIDCSNILIKDLNLTNNYYNIFVVDSKNIIIKNVITNDDIIMVNTNYSIIQNSRIKNFAWLEGISNTFTENIFESYDLNGLVMVGTNLRIVHNLFNFSERLYPQWLLLGVGNSKIDANNVYRGSIWIDKSWNDTFTRNNFYGCYFKITPNYFLNYSNHIFYHNNFYSVKGFEIINCTNTWDNGYPSGGNYWSDYYGRDFYSGPYQNETGSDGIGDTFYVIDRNNIDRYPLMKPFEWLSTKQIKQLAEEYFPHLIFDEKEKFYPTDFFYDDENVTNNPKNYNASWPLTAYVHSEQGLWEGKEWLVIEYWFYYARDAGKFTVQTKWFDYTFYPHDHDWESLYLFFEKQGNEWVPQYAAYFHHSELWFYLSNMSLSLKDCFNLMSWDSANPLQNPEKFDETHPIIHVARDSHASYPRTIFGYAVHLAKVRVPPIAKIDNLPIPIEACDGGRELDYDDFKIIYVDIADPTWPLNFSEIEAPWVRARWSNPFKILDRLKQPIEAGITQVALSESASKLYLHVYDNRSRHVGFNLSTNRVEIEIPGAYYFDLNRTTFIVLPGNVTDFKVRVDASQAEEAKESYDLSITSGIAENLTDQKLISDVIKRGEIQEFSVELTKERIKPIRRTFFVNWNNEIYPVEIISNATVSGFYFSQPDKQIVFEVHSLGAWFCNVTIPKELLGGNFTVYVIYDSYRTELKFSMVQNETYSFIYFEYKGDGTIAIIPEFSSVWIIAFLIMTTLLIVALKLKKRSTKSPSFFKKGITLLYKDPQ